MMKVLFAAVLAGLAAPVLAQSGHDSHHPVEQPAKAQAHRAAGVVKSVSAQKGAVTIAHGPVASLKWPAMTMAFKAKDPKLLDAVKPGQKVEFEFVQQGKDYVITRIR
jgi:Cu(I)/Ag(I) efflux system periplasmic protein CusF